VGKLKQFLRAPKMESPLMAAVVLFGFRVGAQPIGDNSALTHIRTGIDMARTGAIPRADPYSWTAAGTRWVVQSWLPEWIYGWAYRLGGLKLVVFEQAVLLAVLALLMVRLARAGSAPRTALAGMTAIGVGVAVWSPRPLLFGLICLALTITIVERRKRPWLLIPVVWLWVNSHGSFPLGMAWLAARAVGEGLDWRAWPRATWRYVGAFVAGLVVSVLNPLGWRLLAFPVTLGQKSEAFRNIVEWRSPNFSRAGGYLVLGALALALALLLRARLNWRDILPVVGFIAAALLAARNIGPMAVVLAPALGRALRRPDSAPIRSGGNPQMNRAVLATVGAAFAIFAAFIFTSKPVDVVGYPTKSVTWLEKQGLLAEPHRLAEQEFVGNYLTLRYGVRARVFIDDRFDMYPLSVSRDYESLLMPGPGTMDVIDRRQIDVVLWGRNAPIVQMLQAKGWRETFGEKDYAVLQR